MAAVKNAFDAEWLRRECRDNDGVVRLNRKGLTDDDIARMADGLLKVFLGSPGDDRADGDVAPLTLKELNLTSNDFGGDGLGALAKVLSHLPRCRKTLVKVRISRNLNVTTLAPLADAGVLVGLKTLEASGCSLSGDEGVLPPELCANLPALKRIGLSNNKGGATVTLTAEALWALPAECQVFLVDSKVQVARPSPEDGEMGLVALPTAKGEEFGTYYEKTKTVAEIRDFAKVVQCNPRVKAARTGNCASCSSPRPQYACANCKQETYCNERCQKLAWASHKNVCFNS